MIYYIIFVSLEINRFNIHFEIALHNMSSIERYSMAFMMLSNLSVGAGTENVVAEYCRYAPSNVDITIVQTDKPSGKKTYDFLREMPNVHVKTVRGYDWKLSFLQKNSLTTAILYSMLLPVVFFLLKYTVYRNIWAEIGKPRYVYVFNNFYGSLFPEGPVVIGTTHGWNPELGKFYRGQTLITRMVLSGLFWRRIDHYHLINPKYLFFMKKFNRSFYIPNGVTVHSQVVPCRNAMENRVRFLFLGRNEPCKGVMKAVMSYERIIERHSDTELHVIGKGSLSDKIAKFSFIHYHGFVDDEQLEYLMGKCDCLIYPTECDSFPLVVIEALEHGLYVITSDYMRGTFDEFEEMCALEYCHTDIDTLASRMENFLLNPRKMDVNSVMMTIGNRYSWESIVKQLFNQILKLE